MVALRRRDRKKKCACRRSIHPSFGVDANIRRDAAAAGRRGIESCCLKTKEESCV